jgi:hypothetical protein
LLQENKKTNEINKIEAVVKSRIEGANLVDLTQKSLQNIYSPKTLS